MLDVAKALADWLAKGGKIETLPPGSGVRPKKPDGWQEKVRPEHCQNGRQVPRKPTLGD